MELVYLYVDRYEDIFDDIGINFSSNYIAQFSRSERKLIINERQDNIQGFYGVNIKNVSLLLGRNGSGKTTLLDLLGMRWSDRIYYGEEKATWSLPGDELSGFIMYHLNGDRFVFEILGDYTLFDLIENIDNKDINISQLYVGTEKTLVYNYSNEKFSLSNIIRLEIEKPKPKQNQICFAYLAAEKYSNRVLEQNRFLGGGVFPRKYYLEKSVFKKLYMHYSVLCEVEMEEKKKYVVIRNSLRREDANLGIMVKSETPKMSTKEAYLNNMYAKILTYYYDYTLDTVKRRKGLRWETYGDSKVENILNAYKKSLKQKIYTANELKQEMNRFKQLLDDNNMTIDLYSTMDFMRAVESLDESFFCDRDTIMAPLGEVDDNLASLLGVWDRIINVGYGNGFDDATGIDNIFKIIFPPMAEGEECFLKLFAQSIAAVSDVRKGDTVIILIDEPDRAMHPEMARRFLNTFLKRLNSFQDINIQIIISSHSPFIAMDVLPDDVYRISVEQNVRTVTKGGCAFASNIYYLLKDTFMLEKPYGEFAMQKMDEVISLLQSEKCIEENEKQMVKTTISKIGDEAVRKELMIMYYDKIHDVDKRNIINQIMLESDPVKLAKIEQVLKND